MTPKMTVSEIKDEIRVGLNLIDNEEFSNTLMAIADIAAETVAKTLGPYARTTVIDDGDFAYPTKDGWTVLSRLKFPDPLHQSMYRLIRNISFRIVDMVGDGTSTAMITANNFIQAMNQAVQRGDFARYRQTEIVDVLKDVRDELTRILNEDAIQIAQTGETPDYDAIYRIAYISSNGNDTLANAMKDIYTQTNNPNVLVDMAGSTTKDIEFEIREGYRLDANILMKDRYINTSEKSYSTEGNVHMVMIFDHNVSYNSHAKMIQQLMNTVNTMAKNTNQSHSLVLMAPHFDDVMASTIAAVVDQMLKRNPNAIPNIMLIQIPEMATKAQRTAVSDFAAIGNIPITNATKIKIFNDMTYNEGIEDETQHINDPVRQYDEYNFTTAQALMESCMTAVTDATITAKAITLNQIDYDTVKYREAMAQATNEYNEAVSEARRSTTGLMKNLLDANQRLNRLSGRIGIIHVGGVSDLERQCTMDAVDDTFRACRSAYENGVVPGMNMGILCAINKLHKAYEENDDATAVALSETVLNLLHQAFNATTSSILRSKHPDMNATMWKYPKYLTGNEFVNGTVYLSGFNLATQIASDIAAGKITCYDIVKEEVCLDEIPSVINSVSTDIEILNGIVSILGLLITSDQYMSISRFYDKLAAQKQQEALNAKDARARGRAFTAGIDDALNDTEAPTLYNMAVGLSCVGTIGDGIYEC